MNKTEKESALPVSGENPAGTEESAQEKSLWLHITITPRLCQILHGIISWVSLLGLMGVVGGMDQGTIRFVPGMIWTGIFMAAWIASLAAGGWLK